MGKRDAAVGLGVSALLWVITALAFGALWIGVGLLALLLSYIVWRYRHPRVADEEDDEEGPNALWLAIVLLVAGVGVLVFGGNILVTGAIEIATIAGMSETVIGLTIVAIGTSLPELAASAVAAFRGKPGLAIGNVVGSNIYNLLLIGGVTMILVPRPIPSELIDVEFAVVTGSALLIWILLARGKTIGRGLGALLLAGFAANTAFLLISQ